MERKKLPKKEDLVAQAQKAQQPKETPADKSAPTEAQKIDTDIAEKEARIRQIDVDRRLAEAEGIRDKPDRLAQREAELDERAKRLDQDRDELDELTETLAQKGTELANERARLEGIYKRLKEKEEELLKREKELERQISDAEAGIAKGKAMKDYLARLGHAPIHEPRG